MKQPTPGVPALADVTAPDVGASMEFYQTVFGWTYDTTLDPTGYYTYARLGDDVVAGVRPGPADQPPAWTLYLGVADTGAAQSRVSELGGHVLAANQAPEQGEFLIVTDPAEAVVGLWRHRAPWSFRTGDYHSLVWAELHTRESARADKFYAELLGYHQQQIGDGGGYDYTVWSVGDIPVAGRQLMGPDIPPETPPHWLVYFGVPPEFGTDALVERAVAAGASVTTAPTDIPSGRIAVLRDVAGATFGVVDSSRRPADG